tara:strand:+ start:10054 stop:10638 length:585 start_codon:yes stop_codon:yes gene_type:complete
MTEAASVVTESRFEQGIKSFNEWLDIIDIREDQFQRNYDEYQPEENNLNQLQELVNEHGIKALVLGEAWCPDVWRGLPVIAKLSEATGMQARYFIKDDNQDIMSEFLNGEFESIPTVVFYDKDMNYIFHWIERPQEANEEMAVLRDKFLQGVPSEGEERDAAMRAFRVEVAKRSDHWRHLTLFEIVESLKKHLT